MAVPHLSAWRLELGSSAEAKGGGAPTGMSATAAVASRPEYTPSAYGQGVARAFPAAFGDERNPDKPALHCAFPGAQYPHIAQMFAPQSALA